MIKYLNAVNHNAFKISEINGLKLINSEILSQKGFIHGFSTRIGGVSPGQFCSLNLSVTREENQANKTENYKRVCEALNIDYASLTLVNYEHGNGVYVLNEDDCGKGLSKDCDFRHCDALITPYNKVTAVSLHADCVPILMADVSTGIAGTAHAGWKGTLLNIVGQMAGIFYSNFKSKPNDLIVWIGPHIMSRCFEIKNDVAKKFIESNLKETLLFKGEKIFADLQLALLKQLKSVDIPPYNIYCADLCTYCEEKLFYSHRRDKGRTGAMAAFITARN